MARARKKEVVLEGVAGPPAQPDADRALANLLESVDAPKPSERAAPNAPAGLLSARVVAAEGAKFKVLLRRSAEPILAELAPEVDRALVTRALEQKDSVLLETAPGEVPIIVGVLQTRVQDELTLKAGTICLEAEREVVIRAGRAAIRLREDGDVEIVGSRIHAASRGLFRLVGRILRLN